MSLASPSCCHLLSQDHHREASVLPQTISVPVSSESLINKLFSNYIITSKPKQHRSEGQKFSTSCEWSNTTGIKSCSLNVITLL